MRLYLSVPCLTQLDRVWGRGDGAILTQKFTGIAVFVAKLTAPYVRLLGVYKHSFGAAEGSKGGELLLLTGLVLSVVRGQWRTVTVAGYASTFGPSLRVGCVPVRVCACVRGSRCWCRAVHV